MKQTLCSISVIIIVMACHPYWTEEYGTIICDDVWIEE